MDIARIAELLLPFESDASAPSSHQLLNISTYINLLTKWNTATNLTGIRKPDEIVTRHFGESWFAARHLLAPTSTETVIDVGSGAGFPGVVLKLFAPSIHLTLIESQNKKATFLKEVIRELQLRDVQVMNARAETAETPAGLVTLRAVERFGSILPIAARLVAPGGRLALLIGASQLNAAERLVHGNWESPIHVPGSMTRVLSICGHAHSA